MSAKPGRKSHPGRKDHALSMHGVTPEDALRAVRSISPADLEKIKAEEAQAAPKQAKRKGK